jgi:hypothetical protein
LSWGTSDAIRDVPPSATHPIDPTRISGDRARCRRTIRGALCNNVSRLPLSLGTFTTCGRTLAQQKAMAFNVQRNLGMLVLAIWLILNGLASMVALGLPSPVMAVLALIAGILILIGR